MNTKKLAISLVIIAAVIILGGVGAWYWIKSQSDTNTNTANSNANTNTVVHVSLPADAGDITVNKSVTYTNVPFEITTASKTTQFHNATADAGTKFVVLFLSPTQTASPEDALALVQKDVRLTTAGREIAPNSVQIVTPSSTEKAVGYITFVVKDADKDFTLQFGTGTAKKTIALGF